MVEKNYRIRVDVIGPDETIHCRAFDTNFDIRKPEEKQKLLMSILERLGLDLCREMFPVYRPSQVETLEEAYWRLKHGGRPKPK